MATLPAYGVNLTGMAKIYIRNVSNASGVPNVTSGTSSTDVALPLIANGTNNFLSGTVATGYLEFDASFNGGKGGIIVDKMNTDVQYSTRMTPVLLGANTTAVGKIFLAFDKTIPGTGVKISSSPVTIRQNVEQTYNHKFFGNGIEAIYPMINSDVTHDYQLNGFEVTAWEAQ